MTPNPLSVPSPTQPDQIATAAGAAMMNRGQLRTPLVSLVILRLNYLQGFQRFHGGFRIQRGYRTGGPDGRVHGDPLVSQPRELEAELANRLPCFRGHVEPRIL